MGLDHAAGDVRIDNARRHAERHEVMSPGEQETAAIQGEDEIMANTENADLILRKKYGE